MKQKKRGRERGAREGVSERLLCDQPAPTCIPVAMAAVPNRTWWHHLVGLSGWEGGEREGKEKGEDNIT